MKLLMEVLEGYGMLPVQKKKSLSAAKVNNILLNIS